MSSKSAHEVALRIYEAIHGQELIAAERRTVERTRQELNRLGIGDQFDKLFADPQTEANRVREVLKQIREEDLI